MSLALLPFDILNIIIRRYCDILTVLRLERTCKRIRNIIGNRYWQNKDKKIFPHIKDLSADIKIRVIINEIMRIKRYIIDKYETKIIHIFFMYKSMHKTETRRNKYIYTFKHFPEEPLHKDIRLLQRNISFRRQLYPLIKRQYISISDKERSFFAMSRLEIGSLIQVNFSDCRFSLEVRQHVYNKHIPQEYVTRYFLTLKDKYCLTKQELKDWLSIPFELGKEFDYI